MAEQKEGSPLGVLIFIATIVIVGFLLYSIFKPKPPLVDHKTPESFMDSYTEFVSPYMPPSQTRPTVANVEEFLKYFDEDSADYFYENYEAMAYLRVGGDYTPEEWKELGDRSKKGEAVKFLITIGPLRGGFIKDILSEEGARVVVIQSLGNDYRMNLEETPTGFKFDSLMGQEGTISSRIENVRLPN